MSTGQQEGGAYGAGKAGTPFDPLEYIKKPQVILRLASLVCALDNQMTISWVLYNSVDNICCLHHRLCVETKKN